MAVVTGVGAFEHSTGLIKYELVTTDDQGQQNFIGAIYKSDVLPSSITVSYADGSSFQLNLPN